MKIINAIINNIKGLLPYLILISIYFFVVNLEARKEQNKNKLNDINKKLEKHDKDIQEMNLGDSINSDLNIRKRIPVIPFKNNN